MELKKRECYNHEMRNSTGALAAVSGLFLLAFIAALFLRGFDDNTLFSWEWAFFHADAARIYVFLIAGLIISSLLSRTALPDRYDIPFLACVSFAAAVPFWQEPEIIIDASRYFSQAKHLELNGIGYFVKEWGGRISAWTDLPLAPFLYGLIFKAFGENRTAVQAFTTGLFSLTTVLTYLTGKRFWNRETGFAGGLLLLGIPYLLTQVPLMLADVPTMFFLMLAVFSFTDALDRGGGIRTSCAIASILFCVLSKYSAWPMLSVLAFILAVNAFHGSPGQRAQRRKKGLFILFGAACLGGLILLLKFNVISGQMALLREYQAPGLRRWEESFHSTFLFQIHPFITVLAVVSAGLAVRNRDGKYPIAGWLILLVLLFSIKRIRYILPVFPMLTLMAGYGLQIVKAPDLRRFILYGTVTASLAVAFFAYLPLAKSMSTVNLKDAGACLDTLQAGEIEVITLPPRTSPANPAVSVPLLDLFTAKRIRYCYRPEGFPPPGEIESSPLRFTWTYRNPPYYICPDANGNTPVVVLSEVPAAALPDEIARQLKSYRLVNEFARSENIFQYSVSARIYQK